jgi:glycosyltransferase involved in cell wall biosynthesis
MAAPFVAAGLPVKRHVDIILCSTFIDVACLRGLAPSWVQDTPILTYFHENQFAYPVRQKGGDDVGFGFINYFSAMASDGLAFNSDYNLTTFLKGCRGIEKRSPDMTFTQTDLISEKSQVLYPGMDFDKLDAIGMQPRLGETCFVWNHRWEHDKNPEGFFAPFFTLHEKKVPFKLIIVGESFQRYPEVFDQALDRLGEHIAHFGYAKNRNDYLNLIKKADVVVSTANHEFYGMAVIEAVRAGCRPLLPSRLSYPELFPADFLYKSSSDLYQKLRHLCLHGDEMEEVNSKALTNRFSWNSLAEKYQNWFHDYV